MHPPNSLPPSARTVASVISQNLLFSENRGEKNQTRSIYLVLAPSPHPPITSFLGDYDACIGVGAKGSPGSWAERSPLWSRFSSPSCCHHFPASSALHAHQRATACTEQPLSLPQPLQTGGLCVPGSWELSERHLVAFTAYSSSSSSLASLARPGGVGGTGGPGGGSGGALGTSWSSCSKSSHRVKTGAQHTLAPLLPACTFSQALPICGQIS